MELSDARKFLRIDQSLLIVECAEHAVHQEEVHRAYAHACSKRDGAKIAVDEAIAAASEEYRGQKDENSKPYTGERIAFLIQGDETVTARRADYNVLSKEAEMWRAIVDAMQSRRRMLSDLTSLVLQGMPGAPSTSTNATPYSIARRQLGAAREERS